MRFSSASFFFAALLLAACAGIPSPDERMENAISLAQSRGWGKITLPAPPFFITAFGPARGREHTPPFSLRVYIEGDGFSWQNRYLPSPNPTPLAPVGLDLALMDKGPAVYLARPCQYAEPPCFETKWWTSHRFSATARDALSQALDRLKALYGAESLTLIGFSGGGAMAALLAASREDVVQVITVAATLDVAAWTTHHGVTPLDGSLNPADMSSRLAAVPQYHFVGAADNIVPPLVSFSYAARFPEGARPPIDIRLGYDHACCWSRDWPTLLDKALESAKKDMSTERKTPIH